MANIKSVATGSKPAGAVHPVDQILPPARLAVYGLQHVLAFYAGAVIVPLLLAAAIGLSNEQLVHLISADLFTCGIASIIQSVGFWKVGVRLPLIQGVTFTAVAPMIAIGKAASTPPRGTATDIRRCDRSRHCDFSDSPLLQPATAPVSTGGHRYSDHDHRRYLDPGGYPERRWRRHRRSSPQL